jgi:hypothetical protein
VSDRETIVNMLNRAGIDWCEEERRLYDNAHEGQAGTLIIVERGNAGFVFNGNNDLIDVRGLKRMTRLETLLIMAYNIGHQQGETRIVSKTEGRQHVLCLMDMVRDCSLGDLSNPFPAKVVDGWFDLIRLKREGP